MPLPYDKFDKICTAGLDWEAIRLLAGHTLHLLVFVPVILTFPKISRVEDGFEIPIPMKFDTPYMVGLPAELLKEMLDPPPPPLENATPFFVNAPVKLTFPYTSKL